MQGFKRPFIAVSKGGVLKRVCYGPKKLRDWIRYPTLGESSSALCRSDRGHPCCFKGNPSDPEEKGTSGGSGGELSG